MSNKKNPRRKGQRIQSHVNRRLERLKLVYARRLAHRRYKKATAEQWSKEDFKIARTLEFF